MKEENSFQKDMEDLNEWQENQYNPGQYIGTGKVPRHILKLTKYHRLMIIAGLIGLLFSIAALLLTNTSIAGIFLFILAIVFIVGGILRMYKNR